MRPKLLSLFLLVVFLLAIKLIVGCGQSGGGSSGGGSSEITYFDSPVSVDVKNAGKTSLTLFPNNIKYLDFSFSKPEITIPVDAKVYGKVYFKSPSTSKTEYELPINFKF